MIDSEFPGHFSDALVSEIKAEMGRRDLSSRALGRLIGRSSQYMSDRLDGGNSKTGQRVVLNAKDIAAISVALDVDAGDLIARAWTVAEGGRRGYALAASDDERWQARQEYDEELP